MNPDYLWSYSENSDFPSESSSEIGCLLSWLFSLMTVILQFWVEGGFCPDCRVPLLLDAVVQFFGEAGWMEEY